MTDPLSRHVDYGQVPLTEDAVLNDPIAQFRLWLDQADRSNVYESEAMVLSTIDVDGTPSSRTVLLRSADESGLEFFTSYTSAKGKALLVHPAVSVVFPWYSIHRQVIVRGTAKPTEPAVSDAYFASRPRGSQIAAIASDQSQPIASRELLEQRVRDLELLYGKGNGESAGTRAGVGETGSESKGVGTGTGEGTSEVESESMGEGRSDVPRPDTWGGFRIVPHSIEFWQGRSSRLHDRLRFTRLDSGAWAMERLQP